MSTPAPELTKLATDGLAGTLEGVDFQGWSDAMRAEFRNCKYNGHVGGELIYADESRRVWDISIGPGEALPAHCHVLDYMWIALSAGESLQRTADGTTRRVSYARGDQKFFEFKAGEFLLHNLENAGTSRLRFLTVEFLDSANPPLTLQPVTDTDTRKDS